MPIPQSRPMSYSNQWQWSGDFSQWPDEQLETLLQEMREKIPADHDRLVATLFSYDEHRTRARTLVREAASQLFPGG